MEYLCLDIRFEILSRLGVKDLIRLKSVSKTFLDLISSLLSNHDFIRLHLNKSSFKAIHLNKHTYLCLKQHGEYSSLMAIHINRRTYLHCLRQHGGEEVDEIETISFGSCNGLVCLLPRHRRNKYAGGVLLWNPALHEAEYVPIKRPSITFYRYDLLYWFGYDNDEYNLILGTDSHIHPIRLYIDTDSWKSSLEINKYYAHCELMGTLVHRTVYWPAYNEDGTPTIISYDIRNEAVGRIGTPDEMTESHAFVLGQVDGCLSIMFTKPEHVELWVMKEYGVEESWTKLMIIPFNMWCNYRNWGRKPYAVKLDDPAQLSSPIYGKDFYVESLISPRSIKTKI